MDTTFQYIFCTLAVCGIYAIANHLRHIEQAIFNQNKTHDFKYLSNRYIAHKSPGGAIIQMQTGNSFTAISLDHFNNAVEGYNRLHQTDLLKRIL
jgi:hypothetical protein